MKDEHFAPCWKFDYNQLLFLFNHDFNFVSIIMVVIVSGGLMAKRLVKSLLTKSIKR